MTRKEEEDLHIICTRIEGTMAAFVVSLTAHEHLDNIRFKQIDSDLKSHKGKVWQIAMLVVGVLIASTAALLGLR